LQHGLKYCEARKLVDETGVKVFNTQIESGNAEFLVSAQKGFPLVF
jgi:hypothetical protein